MIQLADYEAYYLKDAQTLYLLAPNFSAPSLKVLLNQIGTHQLLVSSIILYPYSFSFTELQQLKANIKTNLDHAPQIIEVLNMKLDKLPYQLDAVQAVINVIDPSQIHNSHFQANPLLNITKRY